jgi:hypothetical protein
MALDREDKRHALLAADERESKKARKRANGRCEIVVIGEGRCSRRDSQTHHMLSGRGRRLTEHGIRAEHKQRACDRCHQEITRHLLQRVGDVVPHYTDKYERAK